ncbi:phenylacetate--CoA ligase family protein [Candidatus Aerophobetes bacterium]|uniref:Phenylacetate-coenzyme A ligase n=1 Tax=Aerophobetes bacterium TaxID=2030807 RepID=A0A523ULD1_UNCAE|nr:MAG: phenylacetate--CoA ligase family protein [Candidatus Aerophobetes bacterium]
MRSPRENPEYLDRESLQELQLKRLRKVLDRVYHKVPFYRKAFRANKVKPENIKNLRDLQRLPFTTTEDLRAGYPYGFLVSSLSHLIRLHTSTGTTGKPKAVLFTQKDIDQATELIARSMRMTGAEPDDVFQNMMSYGLFTGGLIFHYGAERAGLLVIPGGAGNTERQIELMRDFKTTIVHLTPSYVLYLAEVMERMGLSPRDDFNLRIAYLGAEPYSEATKSKIEEIFSLDAYNSYGLSEMNGPGVAFECKEKCGMHLWEDNFIMEVIDPETLEILREGEEGELVLSTIDREAMPILRYRTGDLTRIYPDPCRCGRVHRRISRIKGRVDDMFVLRGVNIFPSEVERILMSLPEVEGNYQILLEREEGLDNMRVRVEIRKKIFRGSLQDLKRLQNKIKAKLKRELMVSPQVELVEPATLPRTTGKAKRLIDKRKI